MILPLALLLLIFLFVHACVPKAITDLTLVEVRRVPVEANPGSGVHPARRGGPVWRLSFEGSAHWVGEVRQHQLNGYATVARCDNRDVELHALGPYVDEVEIGVYADGFATLDPGNRRKLRYDIYLPEAGRYSSARDANAPMPRYDLTQERLELCTRIVGGAMHGAYGRSNEVRVLVGQRG
jgi:hypothetical protein